MQFPTGGAGLVIPGARVFQAGLGASPQSKYSLGLNGTNQYSASADTGFPTGAASRTLAGWFKSATTGTIYQDILIYGTRGVAGRACGILIFASNASGAGGKNCFGISNYDTGLLTGTLDADGNWHHGAATWDGSNWRIYLDGVLKATGSSGSTPNTVSNGIARIGNNTDPGEYFHGNVDDVFICSGVLTGVQIAALAADTLSPQDLTTAGYWDFEDQANPTADKSGNGNSGTLVNGPTFSTDVPSQLQ